MHPPEHRKLAALVFTDMVGSTQLKQDLGDREGLALIQRHHAVVRDLLAQFEEGQEVSTAGDSFFLVFATPSDAVTFALRLQTRLRAMATATRQRVADRVGIHVGEVFIEPGEGADKPKDLLGIHVDTCSRVMSLAQGDQILMTRFAFDNGRSVLKGGDIEGVGPLSWLNHGPYELKGVEEPLEICEVGEAGKGALAPPATSEKARRHVSDESEPVLGWRPALEQKVPGTEWVLERKLGEGGFGEVWLGRHEKLKDRRVFKFCFRADRVRSLKREVTLFRVMKDRVGQHPNIVGIQEVFFDTPPFYIVMDYAEAQDLRAWCEKQGFENIPVATRLEIVAQVADALEAAHAAGVIHRDVKPSNILLSEIPSSEIRTPQAIRVKLTDFGIGQVVSQEALAGLTRLGFTQTMLSPGASSQTGTHLYMAPELLAGQPASTRSDIYSLGVVLYQLLVGDFTRPLTTDWARRITDPLLRADLEQCFAGDPEERFASAGDLARNLRLLERRQSELAERQAGLVIREKTARRRKMARSAATWMLILSVVTVLAAYAFRQARHAMPPQAHPVAVLPFAFADSDNEYFARQMSGELIVKLSKIGALKVTPLTTVLASTTLGKSVAQIGRELKVATLVRGSANRAADRIRLSVEAVDALSEKPLWTTNYDREFKEVFKIQSEVARSISGVLKINLTTAEQQEIEARPTDNFEAYDFYLQGSVGVVERESNNAAAIALLERAVTLDSSFAEAQAELAHAYGVKIFFFRPEDKDALNKGLLAAQRAVAKKPDLAAAHYAQGYLFWTHANRFDHEEAIRAYARAIKLDSSFDEAHHQLGLVYSHLGLTEEARREYDAALAINPNNKGAQFRRIGTLAYGGRFEEAVAVPRRDQDFSPPVWFSHNALMQIYLGRTDEAGATIKEYLGKPEFKDDKGGNATAIEAILRALAGDKGGAEERIALATERGRGFGHWHHAAHYIADAYAAMNQPNEALRLLREAVEDGLPCYPLFRADPILNGLLKGDPQFENLLADLKKGMERYRALDRELFSPRPETQMTAGSDIRK